MEIVGIEINGVDFLDPVENDDSTGYYRAFMHYCIDNYIERIEVTESLNNKFSRNCNDQVFGNAAILNNRIEGYIEVYFSTHSGNKRKKSIIEVIAKKLGFEVFVHWIE